MKTSTQSSNRPYIFRILPIIVLFIGLGGTISAWYIAGADAERELQTTFEEEQEKLVQRLNYNFGKQEDILLNLQDIYKTYVQIVRDVFELYTAFPTVLYPGVKAICFAPKTYPANVERLVLNARMEGYYSYSLYPEGNRDIYFPILYAVPLSSNKTGVGFDLYSDRVRKNAINRAQDDDALSVSGKTLMSSSNDSGFALFAPIYFLNTPHSTVEERRENLEGVVCVEIETKEFFKAISESGGTDRNIEFKIFLENDKNVSSALFNSKKNTAPRIQARKTIDFGGQTFVMELNSTKEFERRHESDYKSIFLIGGLLISILLGLMAYILVFHTTILFSKPKST